MTRCVPVGLLFRGRYRHVILRHGGYVMGASKHRPVVDQSFNTSTASVSRARASSSTAQRLSDLGTYCCAPPLHGPIVAIQRLLPPSDSYGVLSPIAIVLDRAASCPTLIATPVPS